MTDVDDDDLSTLFRTAASDTGAPPPGFDHRSVVAASRRVTVRRRAAVTGVGVALFAAVGVGGMIVLPANQQGGAGETSTAAAPMFESGPEVPLQAPAPGADSRAAAPENNNAPPPAEPDAAGPGRCARCGGRRGGAARAWHARSAPTVRTRRCARWWSRCSPRWSAHPRRPPRWSAVPPGSGG